MAKARTEPAAPPARMITVVRSVAVANGGPTEAEIPETSMASWAKNGWKAKE